MSEHYIRKARVQDVKTIHSLLLHNAGGGLLLPRPMGELYRQVRDFFVVAERDGRAVLGCCALAITWEDIAEVRSLAMDDSLQKKGWGSRLVEACMSEAVSLGIYRVFTLTYRSALFERMGFKTVEKDVLPQKVWADCLNCPKFPECDEIAMLLEL